MTLRPTVVLVHGAFTDASSWWPVTLRLLGAGQDVYAPPVDGHSFTHDALTIRRFVERISGPVLLVGHGYGGAVITTAGSAANVVGLVFVAGYALEAGESISSLRDRFPDADLTRHLASSHRDGWGESDTQLSVDVHSFGHLLAEGVPIDEMQVMAVSQRALSVSTLTEPAETASWHSRPTWAVVAAEDRSINPELQRFAALRANAVKVLELGAPHFVMQTHPTDVIDLILDAIVELSGRS